MASGEREMKVSGEEEMKASGERDGKERLQINFNISIKYQSYPKSPE